MTEVLTPAIGGLFSVVLVSDRLRLDVIQRPCPLSPDFLPPSRLGERAPVSPSARRKVYESPGRFKLRSRADLMKRQPVVGVQAA